MARPKKTILLVEDDPVSERLIVGLIEKMGYRVIATLSTGEAAVEQVTALSPDLILMDIGLKGKMDGIEATQRIKEQYDRPVVYLTGSDDAGTVQRAVATHPFGYIMKPIQEAALKSAIELALIKSEGDRTLRENQTWLSTILNNIHDALISVDRTGRVSFINQWGLESLPVRLSACIGLPFCQVLRLYREETHIAYTNRQGEQRYIDLHHSPLLSPSDSSFEGVLWILRDITNQVLAHRARLLDESRLEALYQMTQMVDQPRTSIVQYAIEAGVRLTKSQLGFMGFIEDTNDLGDLFAFSEPFTDPEAATIDPIQMVDKMPVWKESVQKGRNIIKNLPFPYDPPSQSDACFVIHRYMVVPVFDGTTIKAIVGVANKNNEYDDSDARQITLLFGEMMRILDKKQMEETEAYISIHDGLTKLYNRAYFEEEMNRFSSGRQNPVGLIICDMEDLQMVNEAYGHAYGDQLLVQASLLLSRAFRKGDLIARIGGGRFAVLVPKTTEEAIRKACDRFRARLDQRNQKHPDMPLHVSINYIIRHMDPSRDGPNRPIEDHRIGPDLLEKSRNIESRLTQTLCAILEEQGLFPRLYKEVLEKWTMDLAKALSLPEQIQRALPKFCWVHDIGKIGVPDRILLKPTHLTDREYRKLMDHCIIGQKIALCAPDLIPLAGWILHHHEWWNGKGFPDGIHGKEIPLACRILSVVSSYVERIYPWQHKKPGKWYEAFEQIQSLSGSQFEPRIVETFLHMIRSHSKFHRIPEDLSKEDL